jgi:hypothetical protein
VFDTATVQTYVLIAAALGSGCTAGLLLLACVVIRWMGGR